MLCCSPVPRPCALANRPCGCRLLGLGYSTALAKRAGDPSNKQAHGFRQLRSPRKAIGSIRQGHPGNLELIYKAASCSHSQIGILARNEAQQRIRRNFIGLEMPIMLGQRELREIDCVLPIGCELRIFVELAELRCRAFAILVSPTPGPIHDDRGCVPLEVVLRWRWILDDRGPVDLCQEGRPYR